MDAVDPRHVVWHGAPNPGPWPVTRRLDGVEFDDSGPDRGVRPLTDAGSWPDVTPTGWEGPIRYSLWLLRNIGGTWHGACCLEFFSGKIWTGAPLGQYYSDWINPGKGYGPMEALGNVTPGERIGFLVAAGSHRKKDTSTQPGITSPRERSRIIVVSYVGRGVQMAAGVEEQQPEPKPDPNPGEAPSHSHPDLVKALDNVMGITKDLVSSTTDLAIALKAVTEDLVALRTRVEALEKIASRVEGLEQRPLPTLPTSIRIFGVTVPVSW